MSKEKLLIQRTLQSLLKYGAFLVVILMVVFACSDSVEKDKDLNKDLTAKLTTKIDGAIMGNVIAPNTEIEITASNSKDKIKGTTDANGAFFITGFDEGVYTVAIASADAKKQKVFQDVTVKIGEVTALGTVNFTE